MKNKAEISARNFRKQRPDTALCTRAIVGIDMNGKITIWNQQAEKALLAGTSKDIIGKSIVDTIIPKQLENNHLDQFQHRDGVVNKHYAQ